ncbi:MAG: PQQ-dependent sugar dehydrogenase [Ilumatobacteraceae bacterium]
MMHRTLTILRALSMLVVVSLAGCATNGESADDIGSAILVTTTSTGQSTVTISPSTGSPSTGSPSTGSPSTGSPSTETNDPVPADAPAPSTGTGVPATSAATASPSGSPAVGDPSVGTEVVAEFTKPVDLAVRPGDDSFFVVQQSGQVVRFDGVANTPVFDIAGRISTGNEQGLLGLAFSPGGDRGYVDFTDPAGTTTIAEYQVGADGSFDMDTERILLTVDQPYSNHNGGDLMFGPDDLLYITLGDGGSAGDPERRADDPTSLLGSILRIDPTPGADEPYTIPSDNPFADGRDGAPEVWSFGLRNPWRIAFDALTDELWIADVGQNLYEEVSVVAPSADGPAGRGADFGWSAFEGTERFNADVADPGDLVWPVLTYQHGDDGCSISGGAPYRGSAIADLEPAYVYSDFCSGRLWALDLAGGRNLTLLDGLDSVSSVREGPDGELYILQLSGSLLRLVPSSQ